jgi:hypothetical protein
MTKKTTRRALPTLAPTATAYDRDLAGAWWAQLTEAQRDELSALYDARHEKPGWTSATPDGQWARIPVVFRARWGDPETSREDEMWRRDFLEYCNGHEVGAWIRTAYARTVHVACAAHPAAREVLRNGVLRRDFPCPLRDARCPLRGLLDAACAGRRPASTDQLLLSLDRPATPSRLRASRT